jgi:two-component system, OmpR family, sensor histidine kinase MprB
MSRPPATEPAPPDGGIASDVRHDLRHELATLRTLFTVAQDDSTMDPAKLRTLLATATSEVSYALDLLDTLPPPSARHAVPGLGALSPAGGQQAAAAQHADLAGVLRDAAAVAPGGPSVTVEAAGPLHVAMPRTALVRVVRNLLGNAVAATNDGGAVLLRAERTGPGSAGPAGAEPEGHVRLEVHDDGPGPGRTGFSRSGGQGLTVVRTLVLTAGGWLVLGRSARGGTCASVTLPAARQEVRP